MICQKEFWEDCIKNKLTIKFIMEIKIAKNIQDSIEEDDKIDELTLSDIKTFYKST